MTDKAHKVLTAQLATAVSEIKELRKVIHGNGEPQHSVIGRLKAVEEVIAKSQARLEAVRRALWAVAGTFALQVLVKAPDILRWISANLPKD